MTKLPTRLNHQLTREPAKLLEVARHHYQGGLDSKIHAAFPVGLQESLEKIFLTLLQYAGAALFVWVFARFVTGSESVALFAAIATGIITIILAGGKTTLGIVAVTDKEFVLIQLGDKASFSGGQVIERIDIVSSLLPKPKVYKHGGMMLSEPMAFKKDGDRGWRYASMDDSGTGYVALLNELREFQMLAAAEERVEAEQPQTVG